MKKGGTEGERRREEACCSIAVSKVMQGKYTDPVSKPNILVRSCSDIKYLLSSGV